MNWQMASAVFAGFSFLFGVASVIYLAGGQRQILNQLHGRMDRVEVDIDDHGRRIALHDTEIALFKQFKDGFAAGKRTHEVER